MTYSLNDQESEILSILEKATDGLSRGEISSLLRLSMNDKTLQRRLLSLIDLGYVTKTGEKKGTRYYKNVLKLDNKEQNHSHNVFNFSPESQSILNFLDTPSYAREKKSYNREFLDNYIPNQSSYLKDDLVQELLQAGKRFDRQLAAGTYAQHICQRLLIDLSYNSSRLEGNTYSLLDTKKLVEEGISADGKIHEDAVMIMNHKEAILFLVENAEDIQLNSLMIRNLHQLLSQDLLDNPASCGDVRSIDVSIGKSSYHPISNPHLLREILELILYKAQKIENPFEQSFFLLVHISYLQAFEDVNKRTSRLSCNIPFIKNNLCPLSFTDLSQDDYTAALLAIYERNNITPMIELYVWAYKRSCEQYGIVKQSIGEIDSYRIQYRQQRKEIMGVIIKKNLHAQEAVKQIEIFCHDHNIPNSDKFISITLVDLEKLHVGAIVGLGVTENEFEIWAQSRK